MRYKCGMGKRSTEAQGNNGKEMTGALFLRLGAGCSKCFRLFHHTSCLRLHLYHLRCSGETATKLTNIELLQHFDRARAENKESLQKNAGRAEFQVRLPDT